MKNKPLTDQEQNIAKIIYETIDEMYCHNCRFNNEISEKEVEEKYIGWGCEDCHRKYNGWAISRAESENIARKIIEVLK